MKDPIPHCEFLVRNISATAVADAFVRIACGILVAFTAYFGDIMSSVGIFTIATLGVSLGTCQMRYGFVASNLVHRAVNTLGAAIGLGMLLHWTAPVLWSLL